MDYDLRFSDKEITAWGGLSLLKQMLDRMGFLSMLLGVNFPPQKSNRGYAPTQLFMQFILNIWCGGNRFAHGEVTRFDPTLGKLFGLSKMANFQAVMRFFRKFDQARNDEVFESIHTWLFERIQKDRFTVDLDSTVMTRYGDQAGAKKGYNPKRPGRCSHHPLIAFVADVRMIAACWLRPGNTASAHNAEAFLETTLRHLGNKRIGLLRADSGFCAERFIECVEEKSIPYTIALRLTAPLQRALVENKGWWRLDDGIEVTSFTYQANAWGKARRVIGIRQHIHERKAAKGKQLSLFADDTLYNNYRYSAIVTDLELPEVEIWRLYRGRADCENRIKELKYDFGYDHFCMKHFFATEAALNAAMIAFNLMSFFRQAVLRSSLVRNGKEASIQHTLQTLRYKLFAMPAFIGIEGRKKTIKIALARQRREWFEGLWDASKTFDLPVTFTPYMPTQNL